MTSSLLLLVTLAAIAFPSQHWHGDRAHQGMGFDQKTTTHHFLLERAGGTIEVTSKPGADPATTDQIRTHLRHIASAFANGDFSLPVFIHETDPPGARTMKDRRAQMTFKYEEMPAGGKIVARTVDPQALEALHAFLRFQIREHKTGDPLEPLETR